MLISFFWSVDECNLTRAYGRSPNHLFSFNGPTNCHWLGLRLRTLHLLKTVIFWGFRTGLCRGKTVN